MIPLLALPATAGAVPSFASQTGMPCSQCHVLAFGPALTAYGRQFKLNGYTFGKVDSWMPVALMIQGGFSRSDAAQPTPPAAHFSTNDNGSVDQVSVFVASRITEHSGIFSQGTYSGEDRHFSWDNTDWRYARPVTVFGTDAVVGVSVNNNPTVQDLWNSTPAWGFPYITSPLVPAPVASPVISGGLAQLVVGATGYAMIHEHYYLEVGGYKGLSDRWLSNVGLYPDNNAHVNGFAPYWRAAYQFGSDTHYFSVGTFGLDVRLQPDPTVADADHFTDVGVDATYQYTPEDGPGVVLANTSFIHERQRLDGTFAAGGADEPDNGLTSFEADVSYMWRQTLSAGVGYFDVRGTQDLTLFGPAPLTGSAIGSPGTRGYTLQLECVPFGKLHSFAGPWVNLRLGVQYTGYLRFNGGTAGYDGFGRSASQNDSLFVFAWMAF
jgi:hypothetical protein